MEYIPCLKLENLIFTNKGFRINNPYLYDSYITEQIHRVLGPLDRIVGDGLLTKDSVYNSIERNKEEQNGNSRELSELTNFHKKQIKMNLMNTMVIILSLGSLTYEDNFYFKYPSENIDYKLANEKVQIFEKNYPDEFLTKLLKDIFSIENIQDLPTFYE